tara:strand:+ start:58 stop:336 length:279 start_codon:yes stop_codon:yes gene_type:complete
MTPRKELTPRTVSMICDTLLKHIVGRPVIVSFDHLGQSKDYSVAIQKSLYEYAPDMESGEEGPMYITLNRRLFQDTEELLRVLNEIVEKYRI